MEVEGRERQDAGVPALFPQDRRTIAVTLWHIHRHTHTHKPATEAQICHKLRVVLHCYFRRLKWERERGAERWKAVIQKPEGLTVL